jgi:hypothetical protein
VSDKVLYDEDYYMAKTKPVTKEDSGTLTAWWGMPQSEYYTPFKVEFTDRTLETDNNGRITESLFFRLVRDTKNEVGEKGLNYVDLRRQVLKAWPELPSTVPSVEEIKSGLRFGFLFLSQAWVDAQQAVLVANNSETKMSDLAEGGKWPLGGFEPLIKQLHSQTQDGTLKKALSDVLRLISKKS